MPLLRLFGDDQATTPDRGIQIVFDPDELVCVRPGEGISREKHEIARATQVGVGNSQDVELVGDVWQLTTAQRSASNINEQTAFQDLVIPATDFEYAVPFGTVNCPVSDYNNFRAPTDITGVTILPGITQTSGDTFIRRDIVAGVDQSTNELTYDLPRAPKPPPCLVTNVPVDRLAVGRVTYPENCGFHLRFVVPGTQLHAPDVIGAFYFGGFAYNPNSLTGVGGGIFSLVLYGSGEAELWEFTFTSATSGSWGVRCLFSFAPPDQVAGRVHGITIQPHGTKTISFRIASASRVTSQGRGSNEAPIYAGSPGSSHATHFIASALVSGYIPGSVITGAGNLRLDVRRDLMLCWQVSILDYAGVGILVDHEFVWGAPIPGGTVMTMATNVILPQGCNFDVNLFAADDPGMTTPLPKVYLGGWVWQFSSLGGKRGYFAAFYFSRNGAKHTSPQLRRFSIALDAQYGNRVGKNIIFPSDQSDELTFTTTGPDADPSHETAHIEIINLDGKLTIPRHRGRLKTRIEMGYVDPETANVQTLSLFDGQGVVIERTPFGKITDDFASGGISPYASEYKGDFVGRWARGHEAFSFRHIMVGDFLLDVNLETGKGRPLMVTDIIRDVFLNVIGIPPIMLDIPNIAIPFSGPEVGKDAMIQPKQNPFEYILHLVSNYLGWILFWDRNAGPWGMWRIKPKIDLFGPQSDPLYSFRFGADNWGVDPIAPESYPPETTWIDSYQDWAEAPEYNFIAVAAPDSSTYLPSEGGLTLCKQTAWNPDSFDFDPANPTANPDPDVNPDYVGEMLPAAFYDATVGSIAPEDGGVQGYVDMLARLLIEQFGHARKLFRLRAPFFPVKDATDEFLVGRRPLRHNDPILVGGLPAIVKNQGLEEVRKAAHMMQWIEGVFQTFPTQDNIA